MNKLTKFSVKDYSSKIAQNHKLFKAKLSQNNF